MIRSTRRKSTDYTRLANRCMVCGHRLVMHTADKCTVVTNNTPFRDEANDKPCRCDAI